MGGGVNNTLISKIIIFVIYLISFLNILKMICLIKNKTKKIIFVISIVAFPVATSIIKLVSFQTTVGRMSYGIIFNYLLHFVLFDYNSKNIKLNKKSSIRLVNIFVITGLLFSFNLIDNIYGNFAKAKRINKIQISVLTTFVTQLKETDGYYPNIPVYITQDLSFNKMSEDYKSDFIESKENSIYNIFSVQTSPFKYHYNISGFEQNIYNNTNSFKGLLNDTTGFNINLINYEDSGKVFYEKHKEEISKLPSYPIKGSMAVIDGVLVVN